MSKELFSQIIGPLNKGVNQQADSFVLPGFANTLENANCDLVEGLKKRLGSVPVKRIDTLTQNAGGNSLVGTIKWDEAWYFVYNRSTDERFILIIGDDSRTVSKTVTTVNNSAVVTITSGGITDLFVGSIVSGTNIPSGSKIVEIGTTTFTLDKNATAAGSGITATIESNYTFAAGISDVEPISGTLPEVVPVEQVFANITSTNLEYLRGSGRARDRFRATSFQDYVFITNIQKKTAYDSTEVLTRYNIGSISSAYQPIKGQVWVKLVDYNTIYSVSIELDDGDKIEGHYMTPSLTDDAGTSNVVSSSTIASKLVTNTDVIYATTTNSNSTITNVSPVIINKVHGGEIVTGTGIPSNTFIGTVAASSFTLVNEAGAAVNATATTGTVTPTGDTTNASKEVKSLNSLSGVNIGSKVTGSGIPADSYITAIDGTTITLNNAASATATGVTLTISGTALTIAHGLDDVDINNKLTFTVQDSQILIGCASASRYIKSFVASDARGNSLMSGFSSQVTSIVDLPTTSWEGYTVLVAPDGTADKSSYYLKFNAENTTVAGTFGRGTWEESGGWGTAGKLDSSTMPHSFVYYRRVDNGLTRFTFQPLNGSTYSDGGFTRELYKWVERLSGDNRDDDTGPSFVNHTVNDLVFFKNRFGLISGENVILSEAGSYFNFWQQSALQIIDNDPIDLTAVSNDVAVLNYALQQQDELVLFSNENQFRLYSGDNVTFSPETASVGRISSITMESKVKPQQVGPQVIFPVREGDFTGMHTFITTDRTVGINLGQTAVITETIPKYIPKNIDSLAVSRTDQYLIALSGDDPDALYVYQFFWEATGGSLTNRQNAWSKWTFPNKSMYWCDFVEGTLFTVNKYTENGAVKYYLEGINASRPPQDEKDLFLLDRTLSSSITTDLGAVTFTYSGLTNKTTVNLPYYTVNPSQFVIIKLDKTDVNEAAKRWIVAQSVPAGVNSFVCDSLGDFSGANVSWVFGEKVTFKFTPPQLMPYSKTATDNTFIGNRTGRLQLRYVDVYYNDALYFTIDVTPDFRTKKTYQFDRRDPLNANIVLSQASDFDESKFRAYIQSKNDQVKVEVVNDSIDQAKFVALEWTGLYFDVARKYG